LTLWAPAGAARTEKRTAAVKTRKCMEAFII